MKRRSFLCAALAAVGSLSVATPIKRVQNPTISPDGKVVVFSWQGDLWRVGVGGGRAERLTVHPGTDSVPRFAPDGSRVVFASNRFGSTDIWSMKPDGTDLKRHTFESSTETPNFVGADGYVYGVTNSWSRSDLFKVSLSGGDLIRLTDHPYELEYNISVSPDGKKAYYNRGSYGASSWRKPGVTGSAVGDVWVADNTVPLTNHRNLTKSDANELMPIQLPDGELLHQSNKSGWPNLWKGTKRLTNHRDGTVRNPQVSADGRVVIYEFNSEIWIYDLRSGDNRKLEIEVPDDERTNPVVDLVLSTGLSEYSVARDGKRTVLGIRGELFLIPERGGTTRRLTNNVAWDGHPDWLDPKTLVFASATLDGKRELKTVNVDGVVKPFMTHSEDLTHPTVSPDGKMVAFHRGITEICVVPAGGGEAKVVSVGNYGDALDGGASFTWSPDNKWLAIAKPTDRGVNMVLKAVDGSKEIIVARLARFASAPQFLPNGRGIFFTANETEDTELYVVDLVPADTTFSEDDLDKIDSPRSQEKKEVTVEVFEPWIERRMRRLTSGGASGPVASADSRTIWVNVDSQFSAVPVAGGPASPVPGVTGSALGGSLAANGQKVYFVQTGRLFGLTLGAPAPAPVSYSAQMTVNLRDEEMALFNEIGWAMDRLYYDPNHHGKGWGNIRAKFAKLVPYAFDRTDFYAMMGEMMEELDSSHLGATAPPATVTLGDDNTAYLGVEFDPKALDARGSYIIRRVVDGAPASRPDSRLMVGDKLLKVDGEAPSKTHPLGIHLNKKTGRKVRLEIDRGGKTLEVLIRPESRAAAGNYEYENYVAWQREQVDKLSGGKLAYFHIEGMNAPAHERFLREIRSFTPGKVGALIDVRFNGGGNTAHEALGVLIKTPWLIRTTRGPQGVRISENIFRGDSLELPTGLLINQGSYSNAEVMAEGFRRLGRGPIIGERTPGYVIGTGGYGLWDGGFIRMPSIGAYAIDGENLENNGRRPDFNVPFDPDAWMAGRDPQLEKAVEELLKRIK